MPYTEVWKLEVGDFFPTLDYTLYLKQKEIEALNKHKHGK